jgi:hypothetical protein
MRRISLVSVGLLATALLALPAPARAGLIYESATTAITGPIKSTESGIEADSSFFSGVNFFVSSTAQVQDIGGHFFVPFVAGNNEIFGAIVRVNSATDPPIPADLSGSDVLGTTLITLPPALDSENVSGPLSLTLTPGWYAVIFGSGKFGATSELASAITLSDGQPANTNGVVTYALSQSDGTQIFQAAGARYFVDGQLTSIPEPSAALLLLIGLGAIGAARGRLLTKGRRVS